MLVTRGFVGNLVVQGFGGELQVDGSSGNLVVRGFGGIIATRGYGPPMESNVEITTLTVTAEVSGHTTPVTSRLGRPGKMVLVPQAGRDAIQVSWSTPYTPVSLLTLLLEADLSEGIERVEAWYDGELQHTVYGFGEELVTDSFQLEVSDSSNTVTLRVYSALGPLYEEQRTVEANLSGAPVGMQFEIEYALVTSLANPVPIPQGRIGWRDYDATRDQTSFVDRSRYRGWVWYYRIRFRIHLGGVAVHTSEWSPWASEGPWT